MIVKIIASGRDRQEALTRLKIAIEETVILGVKTNLDLLLRILTHPDFTSAESRTDIDWLDHQLEE